MILTKKTAFVFVAAMLWLQLSAQKGKTITVAQDGTGNYATVQAAFNAIPIKNKSKITVFIKRGFYKEKLRLEREKRFVTLVGEDKFTTVLSFDDHTGKVAPNGEVINTKTSASFLLLADNFTAENITFQNDAGFTAGQAVAIEADGDKAVFNNCRMVGNQDVLFTNNDSSRQFYKNCYIEGTTDFIFGSATALFQQCHIHSKKNSHVTAASTPKDHAFGYIFYDCILTGDTTLHAVSLGRPWQPFASVTYMHCYIDKDIKPEGWSNWNNTENYKTARYSEYKNYGPGSSALQRVSWARQLTDAEAEGITIAKVFGNWKPF